MWLPHLTPSVLLTLLILNFLEHRMRMASLGGSGGKESTCNTGDVDLIPGLGRFPGEGNGSPLQYCCLELGGLSIGMQELDMT